MSAAGEGTDQKDKVELKRAKAFYRRALAEFFLGDLEPALADANTVVQYYLDAEMQNPEASKLKEDIAEAWLVSIKHGS